MIEIPYTDLSPELLEEIIKEFVLQEGTDYGEECSLRIKIAQVKQQLAGGKIKILYDEGSESCNIVPAWQYSK